MTLGLALILSGTPYLGNGHLCTYPLGSPNPVPSLHSPRGMKVSRPLLPMHLVGNRSVDQMSYSHAISSRVFFSLSKFFKMSTQIKHN